MLVIRDNFLDQGSPLLRRLKDKKSWEYLDEELVNPETQSTWWDGKGAGKNMWELLIKQMIDGSESECFEYWSNILDKNGELGWHQDKDEHSFSEEQSARCADVSIVYYGYPHVIKGGYLELAEPNSKDYTHTERIKPVYNRLIMFDPSRFHRVRPVELGTRYGFQVNVWYDPPQKAKEILKGKTK